MKTDMIFKLVMNERERQDIQWGGKIHDKKHKAYTWHAIILKHVCKLSAELNKYSGIKTIQARLITIAAICFAALEALPDERPDQD